ncbi:protein S100-A16-like isoform X2 [Pantherophis guttatus]|uniref:Protein S100-A16-like isoform X2 n=1 Tax=Pantherophis guttatus TaxID=94885 RepID=A0A6P9ATU1_PANGU|nr:protein S100-A16-like isoform X2 [Pantherophis guttatus]
MEGAKGSETVLSELESAIETVVENYNKYSAKENLLRKGGIKKSNFKRMLQSELSHMLTETMKEEAVEKLFQEMDQDGDSLIDFDEYWALIGKIVKLLARNQQ